MADFCYSLQECVLLLPGLLLLHHVGHCLNEGLYMAELVVLTKWVVFHPIVMQKANEFHTVPTPALPFLSISDPSVYMCK
jgi:hypothetical protein